MSTISMVHEYTLDTTRYTNNITSIHLTHEIITNNQVLYIVLVKHNDIPVYIIMLDHHFRYKYSQPVNVGHEIDDSIKLVNNILIKTPLFHCITINDTTISYEYIKIHNKLLLCSYQTSNSHKFYNLCELINISKLLLRIEY